MTLFAITLTDLRETDDGIYSVSYAGDDITDIINLEVLGKTILPFNTINRKKTNILNNVLHRWMK